VKRTSIDIDKREIKVRNGFFKILLLEMMKLLKKNKKLEAQILNKDLKED